MSATLTLNSNRRFLTFLTRRFSHPWMPMALFIPLGILLIALAQKTDPRGWAGVAAWIAGGAFLWTLIEYGLHRFVFHWTEVKEPWRTVASGLHMAHHRSDEAAELILAPPFVSLVFGTIIFGILNLVVWSFSRAALLEAGIFLGYLAYEWVHYSVHRFKARTPLGRHWKRHHLHHHFKAPRRSFGVTSPLWDWVFGTLPNPK
jgi:sterol desaturase/sphingolipid hydroxylase (fatty acid hydroxylase superfamily)